METKEQKEARRRRHLAEAAKADAFAAELEQAAETEPPKVAHRTRGHAAMMRDVAALRRRLAKALAAVALVAALCASVAGCTGRRGPMPGPGAETAADGGLGPCGAPPVCGTAAPGEDRSHPVCPSGCPAACGGTVGRESPDGPVLYCVDGELPTCADGTTPVCAEGL